MVLILFNRLRAFRRAKVLWLWFLRLWDWGLRFLEQCGQMLMQSCTKFNANIYSTISTKIVEQTKKKLPESIQNRSKINLKLIKMCLGTVLANMQRPGRLQERSGGKRAEILEAILAKKVIPMADFVIPLDPRIAPKSHF